MREGIGVLNRCLDGERGRFLRLTRRGVCWNREFHEGFGELGEGIAFEEVGGGDAEGTKAEAFENRDVTGLGDGPEGDAGEIVVGGDDLKISDEAAGDASAARVGVDSECHERKLIGEEFVFDGAEDFFGGVGG